LIIVVSGPPGSGKTTQARRIAEEYGLKYYSAGSIFREIARERGLSLEELSIIAARDPTIDIEIDRRSRMAAEQDNIVIDGHLTAWILADKADLKILVTAPLMTRIRRIALRDNKSLQDAFRETIVREYLQWTRFIKYYGLDTGYTGFFDLVVNTEKADPDTVFSIIKSRIEKLLKR
jgi:cytidylate kinase